MGRTRLRRERRRLQMPEERTDAQTFKGSPLTLVGPVLERGTAAPDFKLVKNDLSDATLASYAGKVKILNVVPSLDTAVCDAQTRRFNEEAANLGSEVVVLGVSRDLPFAQKRWCGAAGVAPLSPASMVFPRSPRRRRSAPAFTSRRRVDAGLPGPSRSCRAGRGRPRPSSPRRRGRRAR